MVKICYFIASRSSSGYGPTVQIGDQVKQALSNDTGSFDLGDMLALTLIAASAANAKPSNPGEAEPPPDSGPRVCKKPLPPIDRREDCPGCLINKADLGKKYCLTCAPPKAPAMQQPSPKVKERVCKICSKDFTPPERFPFAANCPDCHEAHKAKAQPVSTGTHRCNNSECGKPFVPVYSGAKYCVGCARAYKAKLEADKAKRLKDPEWIKAAEARLDADRRAADDQRFMSRVIHAFVTNPKDLPEGVTLKSRSGTQTVFLLPGGRSVTVHIPKTPAELALEQAAREEAAAAQRKADEAAHAKRKAEQALNERRAELLKAYQAGKLPDGVTAMKDAKDANKVTFTFADGSPELTASIPKPESKKDKGDKGGKKNGKGKKKG